MKETKNKIKYFLYARKSSEAEDRQVASIDAQIDELTKIARNDSLEIVDSFTESQSAKEPGRPVFNEMIRRVHNKEANGILCWKLDRLARNPIDGGQIGWMLQEEILQSIKTYGKEYTSEDNSIVIGVEFGQANQFVRDLSVNVKRGLRKKVKDGWLPGVAPAGYLNTPDKEKGYKVIIEDPERFPLIRRMWDLMLTGNYNPSRICEMANKEWGYKTVQRRREGGNPISRSAVYKIFTNTFYYGWFEYPSGSGEWVKGKHKPMITEEEFQRVQILLGRKGKPAPKKHLFAFTGLMKCAVCDSAVTAEEKVKRQKNGNVHHYIYYHCTKKKNSGCLERSIEVKELQKQIDKKLEEITISEEFKDWAIKHLHEIRTTEADTHNITFQNKQRELEGVSEQLGSLLLKYTSPENKDGHLISDKEYDSLKNTLLRRKESLESELQGQGKELEQWLELSERTFNFARYARVWFKKGDVDVKRSILACIGSNLSVKDQKLTVELRPVFQTLFNNREKIGVATDSARTSTNPLSKRENGDFDSVCPSWLPG